MKRLLPAILTIIGCISIGLVGGTNASAEEMSFSVEAKIPENQRDKTKTYFDLAVKPGEVENLEVEMKNNSDKEVTVLVNANTAITNDNGVIDYSATKPELDASLKNSFAAMAKTDTEVTLAPKETKMVTVQVTLPKEAFNGIILGGLHFTQKDGKETGKADSGVQIENKFAYVIGVRLSENEEPVTPDLKLTEVKAGQRNYRNTVLATLQNPMPRILGTMTVTADVFSAGNMDAPVYHSKQENLNMAPNSNFAYGISTDNKAFKAGKYVLKMVAEAAGEKWEFEQEFEIKNEEAKKFNDEAVELAEETTDYTLYFIIGGVVLALAIIAFIIQNARHKAKIREEQARKKAKRMKNSKSKSNTDRSKSAPKKRKPKSNTNRQQNK